MYEFPVMGRGKQDLGIGRYVFLPRLVLYTKNKKMGINTDR